MRTEGPRGQGDVVRLAPDAAPGVKPGATLFQGPEILPQEVRIAPPPTEQARQLGILVEAGHDYVITSAEFPAIPPLALAENIFVATTNRIRRLRSMSSETESSVVKRQIEGQMAALTASRDENFGRALEAEGIMPQNSTNRVGFGKPM